MFELTLLRALLLTSMAIAPLGTHYMLWPKPSRWRLAAHAGALACAAIGVFAASVFCVVWLGFCAASFALFVRARFASLRAIASVDAAGLAVCVPFLFSNVAAVWLVGGSNDLHILGYDIYFSYYAALHGTVLGWMVLGAIAILVDRDPPRRRIYIAATGVALVSFLLIAFGIDQLRALKPVGVTGISIAIPIAQLAFLRGAWARNRAAFAAGCVSFVGFIFTIVLAWRNELGLPVGSAITGIRGIVSVHGALNAFVVAPAFLLAVAISAGDSSRSRDVTAMPP